VGSTPGLVAIKWILLGWVTVCVQVDHLDRPIEPTPKSTQPSIFTGYVNRVLARLAGFTAGAFIYSVGWQVIPHGR